MKKVKVEKEMPFGRVGKISCNNKGYYWFEGQSFNHDTICCWIAKGFLSWVEEEKTLEEKFIEYLKNTNVYGNGMKALGLAKIANEHYAQVADKAFLRWLGEYKESPLDGPSTYNSLQKYISDAIKGDK